MLVSIRIAVARLLHGVAYLLICQCVALAQQVPSDPASSHIFPAGGQRGTKVAVRVGGECLPPMTRFRLFGKGLSAQEELGPKAPSHGDPSPRRKPGEVHIYYAKEWHHQVDIAADAPLGMGLWRLSCARGGTGGRPFLVGELPEFIETESNSTLGRAETVSLPITINGQIDGERDLDYFQFEAREGEVVTADVMSRRLGSPLETVVDFYDDQGSRVPAQTYRMGSDPILGLRVPRTGTYRLMLAHLGFHGGPQYVYRVTLSTSPFVPVVFPAGGQAGSSRSFEWYALTGRGELHSVPFEFTLPAVARSDQWFQGGLPSYNSVVLEAGDLPDVVEQEDNNAVVDAQWLLTPCQVHGQFLAARDEDWFQFTAAKDSLWAVECRRFPAGSDCLPIMTLTDAGGEPLASVNMAEDPRQPCRLQWRSPADGSYCLRLRDVQQGIRGGSDFIYRLSLRPASPEFELKLAADFLNVVQGAKGEIELSSRRMGGFTGPIDLHVEGLPEGMRYEPHQLAAGQDSIKLAFVADDKARPCDVSLKIRGSGTHEGTSLSAVALAPHLGHDSEGVSAGPPLVDHIQLTLRHKPMLRLYCSEAYQYAYRGTVYPYAMEVERLQGFTGPIHLEVADRQIKDLDGIVVQEITLEPGQSKFMLPLYLPETMHINVQAHSNVYAQAYVVFQDAWGQKQSQLFVSEMRCMIRPLPAVVKLSAVDSEVHGRLGETVTCHLRLDRTSLFSGAMKIELVESAADSGYVAQPITIEPDQTTATVHVHLPTNSGFSAPTQLKFRATGELPGYASVVSEATVKLSQPSEVE